MDAMSNIKFNTTKFVKQDKNKILCELGGNQQFYITIPQNKDDYYFVELPIVLVGFAWLNKINEFIFNKNPDLQTLITYIEEEYSKNNSVKKEKRTDLMNIPDLEIDMFDLEERKYRRELESNISAGLMKSKLNLNAGNDTGTALFSGKVSSALIMNEFFELRKKYSRNANVKLVLDNNNVYTWNIKFTNFGQKLDGQLKELNEKYKYNYIEVEIHFHDKLYPGYPPFIRVVRPRLDNGLMNRLTNMKMVQLDYWSPCRGMSFIVNKLYDTLNNHCVIDLTSDMNDLTKFPSGAYHNLEAILVKLAALCSLDNQQLNIKDDNNVKGNNDTTPLDTEVYNKVNTSGSKVATAVKPTSSKKHTDTIWKKGTGYGHSGAADWDPNEYIKMQEEKDKQIKSVLTVIMETLHSYTKEELPLVYNIIKNSYLLPFIKSYLQGANILDMGKRFEMYQFILLFMQILATDESAFLFDSFGETKGLYELLVILNREAQQVAKLTKMNEDKDESSKKINNHDENFDIATMICALYDMVDPIFKNYLENKKKYEVDDKDKWATKIEKAKSTLDEKHENYLSTMDTIKFDTAKFASKYAYSDHTKTGSSSKLMTKRLASEYASMISGLPIFYESSIFVRVNEIDNRAVKILITGPEDTPYDSGCLIFDLYTGDKYPDSIPKMLFKNHGGVRFNPNLYNCGKVCLSLLGTWNGKGGEVWNPKTSTLQQLFVSIQSQILIENPFYNEPGHESSYNSASGQETSRQYNNERRYYTLRYTMYDLLLNLDSYPEFTDVIKKHFTLKKDYIIALCEKWKAEPNNNFSDKTIEYADKVKELVSKL